MKYPRGVELSKLRDRIDVLKRKIECASEMIVPLEKAHRRAQELVDDLAEAGAISGRVFSDADYTRPRFDDSTDVLRLLAWVAPDLIKDRLKQTIDDFYGEFDGSFDSPDTHRSIAKDREALFLLEVEEEKLIMASHAEGIALARRADADPRAVLAA